MIPYKWNIVVYRNYNKQKMTKKLFFSKINSNWANKSTKSLSFFVIDVQCFFFCLLIWFILRFVSFYVLLLFSFFLWYQNGNQTKFNSIKRKFPYFLFILFLSDFISNRFHVDFEFSMFVFLANRLNKHFLFFNVVLKYSSIKHK